MPQTTKRSEYLKEYREKNRDKIREYGRAYSAAYREANLDKIKEYSMSPKEVARRKNNAKRTMEYIREQKNKPCTDCGNNYPFYVMQFDHVRGKKLFTIASGRLYGLEKIKEEIAKCEVVCANCHMVRTHSRRGEKS